MGGSAGPRKGIITANAADLVAADLGVLVFFTACLK